MDEAMLQAWAHLNAHNTLLRTLYANWFAQMSEAEAEGVAADIRRSMRKVKAPPLADERTVEQHGLQMMRDAADLGDHFLRQVEARAAEIRAARAGGA